jgi:hypothetical protein
VVQHDDAVKVGHRHGAASLVTVPSCTPHVSVFRPVERERKRMQEREKERSARLITCAGQRMAPMVTIEQVSMLLRESMRKRGDEWFLHPHFNHYLHRDG